MTDEELNAIQKACDEATAGPWERRHLRGFLLGNSQVIGPKGPSTYNEWVAEIEAKPTPQVLADGEFIAGARQWVPALVAEVRSLRADLDKQEEQYRKEFWDIFNAFTANAERLEAEGEKEAAIEWWAARKMLKNP